MDNKELVINNISIPPGEKQIVTLAVGKLPLGQRIGVKAYIYRALAPGPVVLFMGGLHGDEINGVETLKREIIYGTFDALQAGTIIAIPLLNVYGFLNFSRDLPDGKDVNRSFPGNSRGSLASRIANVITKKILPLIDFGIDLHTGAALRYNYPQIRYNAGDPRSKELAEVFNPPVMFPQATISKSLRKIARNMQKPILVFEGGESLRLDEYVIKVALRGILNILVHHGMLPGDLTRSEALHFGHTAWIRASAAGIFVPFKQSGEYLEKGTPIGNICDPFGDQMAIVTASRSGFVIGHNNTAVVNQGDALFHVAY